MQTRSSLFAAMIGMAIFAFPAAAQAQASLPGEGFIGVHGGYHDLGVDTEDFEFTGLDIDTASPIVGVFAGYDLPIGIGTFAGIEGNYTYGFDAIDSEVGASVRVGMTAPGGAKFYARGGYQWVDLDLEEVVNVDLDDVDLSDIDDSEGDYLVGLGVDFGLGRSLLRVNLDSIGFDTLRATAGVGVKF